MALSWILSTTKKKKMKNLGKVPILQKKKSTSQYQWKSYESTLMLDFN